MKLVSSCHVFFSFAGSAVLVDLLRNGSVPFKEPADTFVSPCVSSFQMEQKKSPLCSLSLYYGKSSDPCQADEGLFQALKSTSGSGIGTFVKQAALSQHKRRNQPKLCGKTLTEGLSIEAQLIRMGFYGHSWFLAHRPPYGKVLRELTLIISANAFSQPLIEFQRGLLYTKFKTYVFKLQIKFISSWITQI